MIMNDESVWGDGIFVMEVILLIFFSFAMFLTQLVCSFMNGIWDTKRRFCVLNHSATKQLKISLKSGFLFYFFCSKYIIS